MNVAQLIEPNSVCNQKYQIISLCASAVNETGGGTPQTRSFLGKVDEPTHDYYP
jgi:hypothetical protein